MGLATEAAISSLWYATRLYLLFGHDRALPELEGALAFARARGLAGAVHQILTSVMYAYIDIGDLDRAAGLAVDLQSQASASGEPSLAAMCTTALLRVQVLRGNLDALPALVDGLDLASADEIGEWPTCMTILATAEWALGRGEAVAVRLNALADMDPAFRDQDYRTSMAEAVQVAVEAGLMPVVERLLEGVVPRYPAERIAARFVEGCVAEAMGNVDVASGAFNDAAIGYADLVNRPAEGMAWLGVARVESSRGQSGAAAAALQRARGCFELLSAAPWLARCSELEARLAPTGTGT